jgi:hypothetical protein
MKNNLANILIPLVICAFLYGASLPAGAKCYTCKGYIAKSDTDYRNQYTGYYHAVIYRTFYQPEPIYDTIDTILTVRKFQGFTTPSCSNYADLAHKVSIVWGAYDTTYDDSYCGWLCYYTDLFIHPSVNSMGVMNYSELNSCGGQFNGHFTSDSIYVDYLQAEQMYGFHHRIYGVKDSVLTAINPVITPQYEEFEIYPNPVRDHLYLNFKNSIYPKGSITIFNANGKQVLEEVFLNPNQPVETGDLLPGIYLLKIQTESYIMVKKFVKYFN